MNRDNLIKLRDGLVALPEDYESFDMLNFYGPISSKAAQANAPLPSCGTTACAMGHAPSMVTPGLPNEKWIQYSNRVFSIDFTEMVWHWLFSGEWWGVDNTLGGAVKRIDYYLAHGLPEGFDLRDIHEWDDFDFKLGFAAYSQS